MLDSYNPNSLSTLIDSDNNIIEIRYNNLIFRDSYRIFPASLKKLAEICNTVNRKLELQHDSVTLDLIYDSNFYTKSLLYLKADINTLYEVINVLRKDLLKEYKIPLRDIYSASNMAFKVYRSTYLKKEIEASS